MFSSGHPDFKTVIRQSFFFEIFFMFTVYILFSKTCQKFYTGHTADLTNRISEHNQGETKSIKSCIPWEVIWQFQVDSRGEAMVLENRIKKRGAKRFLHDQNISLT